MLVQVKTINGLYLLDTDCLEFVEKKYKNEYNPVIDIYYIGSGSKPKTIQMMSINDLHDFFERICKSFYYRQAVDFGNKLAVLENICGVELLKESQFMLNLYYQKSFARRSVILDSEEVLNKHYSFIKECLSYKSNGLL